MVNVQSSNATLKMQADFYFIFVYTNVVKLVVLLDSGIEPGTSSLKILQCLLPHHPNYLHAGA